MAITETLAVCRTLRFDPDAGAFNPLAASPVRALSSHVRRSSLPSHRRPRERTYPPNVTSTTPPIPTTSPSTRFQVTGSFNKSAASRNVHRVAL